MQAFYLYATGRTPEAQAALEQLTHDQPGYAEAWRLLGNLRLNGGDATGALAALDHSDGKQPTATGAGLRAEALMKLGRLDEAQAAGEQSVRLHAGRNERITLARIYEGAPDEARQRQAEALLEQVVAAGEKDPSIVMLLAVSQRRLGEPAKEVKTLRKLLRLDPYSAPGYFMLAHAYRELRKRELSERCLAVYRRIEPQDARVRVARLATLADPSSPTAQLALAASLREEGRIAEATTALEHSRQLGASGSAVQAEAGRIRKAGSPAPPALPADPEGDLP
jgi:cytochrome c-type biogenesis protein CcmH/NrfG